MKICPLPYVIACFRIEKGTKNNYFLRTRAAIRKAVRAVFGASQTAASSSITPAGKVRRTRKAMADALQSH